MFIHSIAEIAGCPPNGSCQLAVYSQLVTSSIIGPVDEASESGLLRATLPTEVETVFTYVMPVASSLMMQLVLAVDILWAATSPMGMVPRVVQGPPPLALVSADRLSLLQSQMAELVAV